MLQYYYKIMITNFLVLFKKSPLLAFIKFETTFRNRFFGSLPFRSGSRLFVGQARRGGRKGGVGGIPPAEPSQFRSDIFKQTPPVRK